MYDTLIAPFDGMEDWQPIFHAAFTLHFDGHETVTESYLETLYTNQRAECSRFKNKTISWTWERNNFVKQSTIRSK